MVVKAWKFNSLQWQSFSMVAVVTLICTGVTSWYAAERWTAATKTVLLLSMAFAAAVWLSRAATPLAAITGGILTATMLLPGRGSGAGDWFRTAFLPLLSLCLLTFGATRLGRTKKEALGTAQDAHGRDEAQVVANLGVASAAAALSLVLSLRGGGEHWGSLCMTMLVAALSEATADTLSSELGAVFGDHPFLITTSERVAVGTDGAISVAGTLAGLGGAIAVVLVAVPTLGLGPYAAFSAAVGAVVGMFFDSLLGATAERRGRLNNDAVNFLSTLGAACVALLLSIMWLSS